MSAGVTFSNLAVFADKVLKALLSAANDNYAAALLHKPGRHGFTNIAGGSYHKYFFVGERHGCQAFDREILQWMGVEETQSAQLTQLPKATLDVSQLRREQSLATAAKGISDRGWRARSSSDFTDYAKGPQNNPSRCRWFVLMCVESSGYISARGEHNSAEDWCSY